jgi:maltooligosyltrehalose trehalohydrolase
VPLTPGVTEFRVWAPNAAAVAVRVRGADHELAGEGDGVFAAAVPAAAGDDYVYVLDDAAAWPDPCSRFQPHGVRGPSRVVDASEFHWTDARWEGVTRDDLVLYELHVGAFTSEGTFDAVVPRLAGLRELGVTAIELMPVATFPGERGWGYDGVYTFAPHAAYGGPAALARLVDAAHAEGLAVVLDVVYNHVGPGSDALTAFGPYFTNRYSTPWGDAMNYDGEDSWAVREWAIQNACMWIRDYHVDGLRFDAVSDVHDEGERHVLQELVQRVRALNRRAVAISELEIGDLRPIREWGHDAQWSDVLHNAVHALVTGESDAYYEHFGTVAQVAEALTHPDAGRLVVCAQNHDQIGNRPAGDRLRGAKLRLAAFCSILSPCTPLLFMGEEYDEAHPFQFFTDHIDPLFADATREGRKREFAGFAGFSGDDVPDPQALETFQRSKLDPSSADEDHRAYYADLLRLRRALPDGPLETEVDEDARALRVRRGDAELVMNFSDLEYDDVPPWTGLVRWASKR